MRTVKQVKNEIEEIDRKLEEGVPADKAHVLRMDKVELGDELRELEQVQELPTEEATTEVILETVDGQPLELYTEYPALIRGEVATILAVERLIAKEAHDVTKGLLKVEQGLVRDLLERNGRLESDYQGVIESENKLQIELGETALRASDFEQKHRAAANRVLELEEELKEALITINRNKEFKALTDAEITAQAEQERQKLIDSKIKIYNVRDADEAFG